MIITGKPVITGRIVPWKRGNEKGGSWTDSKKKNKIGQMTVCRQTNGGEGDAMNPTLKRILNALLIIASLSAVFIIAFSNTELKDAWGALRQMDLRWALCIVLCYVAYMGFESLGTLLYLRGQGFKISTGRTLIATLIGYYYCNITPGAAGGQPMQINSLRKAGIPVGYGTVAVSIRFIANQFMVCLLSLVLLLINREFVYQQLGDAIWFVRIGWVINFASVPLVLLAAFKRTWVQKLAVAVINLGCRLHLIRDKETVTARVTDTLDTYHMAMKDMFRSVGRIITQLLCSAGSILGLISMVVFVYYAFHQSGTSWFRLLTLGALLFVSASYTPLPGASGAQEGGFMLYFRGIFKDGTIGLALLTWRFFNYYLTLIVGAITLLIEKMAVKKSIQSPQTNELPNEDETSQK